MNIDSHDKLMKAGYSIIRKDDHPAPRIKTYIGDGNWKTLRKFETKRARDAEYEALLRDNIDIIDD